MRITKPLLLSALAIAATSTVILEAHASTTPLMKPLNSSNLSSSVNGNSLQNFHSEQDRITNELKVKELDERLSRIDGIASFSSTKELAGKSLKQRVEEMSAFLLMELQSSTSNINTFIENHGSVVSALNQAAAAQNTANLGVSKANAAQSTANRGVGLARDGIKRANAAQSTANQGVSLANAAQSTANQGVSLAITAQGRANAAYSYAGNAYNQANLALTTAQSAESTIANSSATVNELSDLETRLQSQIDNLKNSVAPEPEPTPVKYTSTNVKQYCEGISRKYAGWRYSFTRTKAITHPEGEAPSYSKYVNCEADPQGFRETAVFLGAQWITVNPGRTPTDLQITFDPTQKYFY